MTLLDNIDKFMRAYVRRTVESKSNEENAFKASDYGEDTKKWRSDKKLTPTKRREIALTAPFFMKASKFFTSQKRSQAEEKPPNGEH